MRHAVLWCNGSKIIDQWGLLQVGLYALSGIAPEVGPHHLMLSTCIQGHVSLFKSGARGFFARAPDWGTVQD